METSDRAPFVDVCLEAVRAGGRVLDDMRGRITAREKAPKDLVTEADLNSQRVIRDIVKKAFPDHAFVGEEQLEGEPDDPGQQDPLSQYCWIVDPLDGTMNYVHQLPGYAVSVALRRGDQLLVGAVYDPVMDECFVAQAGQGATLNGVPLEASGCRQLREALIAASLPADVPRDSDEVGRFVEVLHHCQAIRRLGSAALNLCYVAAGRLDGYWATCVKPWDVAAGALILLEAGAVLSNLEGGPFHLDRPRFVAAATPRLHDQLRAALAKATD